MRAVKENIETPPVVTLDGLKRMTDRFIASLTDKEREVLRTRFKQLDIKDESVFDTLVVAPVKVKKGRGQRRSRRNETRYKRRAEAERQKLNRVTAAAHADLLARLDRTAGAVIL